MPKILDCTIRDGGHLNKWWFDPLCVKASYYAALKGGADYFEIGYRCPDRIEGLGPFGYCRDEYLASLFHASDRCRIAVMIDAGKADMTLFAPCRPENTPVRAVRVAAYPYELRLAIGQLEELHSLGYEVFLNLMASSELGEEEFAILRAWEGKNLLEAVTFADSFGAFIPSDIPLHVKALREVGFERIGFHPHNNLQMAFANTLRAIEEGVEIVDASIFGMGRGSGNLPIEVLTGYLEKQGDRRYNTVPYLDVIERYYLALFRELDWGYKIQSLMGGLKNIHPYYIDDLFRRKLYTVDEIWNALDFVKEKCPISYSMEKLNETLESRFFNPITKERIVDVCDQVGEQMKIIPARDAFRVGRSSLTGRHAGRKFLVIATGPSIIRHRDRILRFIADEDCVTIGVNYMQGNYSPDYHMFLNRKRFLKYAPDVAPESTLLLPGFFGRQLVEENFGGRVEYFDMVTSDDPSSPPVVGEEQRPGHLNVAVSAILMASQMGAKEIFAVGMDGYADETDRKIVYFYNEDDAVDEKAIASMRYEMLSEELNRVNRYLQEKSVPFTIITPTSHRKYYGNRME